MIKYKKIILLTILAFILRVVFYDTSYFFWDEAVYLMQAQWFFTGNAPYLNLIERPPLLPLIISPFYRSEVLILFFIAFINSLFVPLIYFFGKELNEKTGFLSALFVTFMPYHILFSRWIMTDALAALLLTATLFFYWKGLKNRNNLIILGGIFFGLSILMKFTNLIIVFLLFPMIVYFRKKNIIRIVISFISVFIVLIPFFIFSYVQFGSILSIFQAAFHTITDKIPVSIGFTIWTIIDFLGPVLLFLFIIGLYRVLRTKNNALISYLIYWVVLSVSFYIFLSFKGAAKPPSIEWEMERFLCPIIAPSVIIIGHYAQKFNKKFIFILVVLFLLTGIPNYIKAYTPAIKYEEGLRHVTKDAGLYIKENTNINSTIYCNFNCPSVAYYSQRETKIITINGFKIDDYSKNSYFLIISQFEHDIKLNKTKSIKNKSWSANLYEYR